MEKNYERIICKRRELEKGLATGTYNVFLWLCCRVQPGSKHRMLRATRENVDKQPISLIPVFCRNHVSVDVNPDNRTNFVNFLIESKVA